MKRIWSLILAIVAAAFLLPPPAARAHAALAQATPAPGTTLEVAPATLSLEFTERLDPAFSRVQLFDASNTLVAATELVRPEAPYQLVLALPALEQGSYTALWRVRSSEDGHVTEGAVPFGVGVAADLGAALPPVGAPAPALAPPPLLGALGRWLALAGAALAVGPLGFALLVWRPAWRAASHPTRVDEAMAAGLRRLVRIGAILLALAGPLALVGQAASAAESGESVLATLPALLAGTSGTLIGGRTLVALALGLQARALKQPGAGPARPWWVAAALGGALLLAFPASGHGAAAGTLAPALIAAGFVHMAAMALWLGGLPALLLAAAHARHEAAGPPLRALVQRFTPVAMACVVAVALSGTAQALAHVGSLDLLPATTYGRALLVKLAAFAAMSGLGALHWLVIGPRLRPGGAWASQFRAALAAELGLGLLILGAAGVQLNVAPSRTAMEAQTQLGQRLEAAAEQVEMVLWLTPGGTGDNLLALDVRDRRASAGGPPEVLFRFQMPGMEMGTLEAAAAEAAPNRFQARGSYLTMSGRWTVEAILRRPGMDDVRHTFVVDVRSRPDS